MHRRMSPQGPGTSGFKDVATHIYVRARRYKSHMDFYVEGAAPDGGHPQAAYRGWVLATSYAPDRSEIYLLVSDESAGPGTERLRTVPSTSVRTHRFAAPVSEVSTP